MRGYTHPCSCHLLFQFGNAGASAFIKTIFPYVQSAASWGNKKPLMMLNIGLTFSGIQKAKGITTGFPTTFMNGPTSSDSQLSLFDLGKSSPSTWAFGNSSNPVDCIVHVYAMTPDALEKLVTIVTEAAQANGLNEILPLDGGKERLEQYPLEPDFIHFGYRDGIDQPDLDDSLQPAPPSNFTDPANLNNFLIGYGGQYSAFGPGPTSGAAGTFARNGCYNAFRLLYQDVEAFDDFLADNAPAIAQKIGKPVDYAKEWLAAKINGRWRNGSPLILSPDAPDPATATATAFSYSKDDKGMKCPFSAHTRVANPRDEPVFAQDLPVPRLIRRGVPYGAPPKGNDYSGERGLIGLFLCGALDSQFELIYSWINTNNFSSFFKPAFNTQDALIANRAVPSADTSFTMPTEFGSIQLSPLPAMIITRGTAYCLLPSLAALQSCFE